MIGVGKIFQSLSDETIVADDEVAVRHGPAELGYLPLNQSLVDIRDSCAGPLEERIIGVSIAEKIISAAKALPFWDRSYDAIAAQLRRLEPSESREIDVWLEYTRSRYVSLKARDAAALLAEMRDFIAKPWQPKQVSFAYERTIFVDRLLNEIALEKVHKSLNLPQVSADREALLMNDLRRAALLRLVARDRAKHSGWQLNPVEMTERASALWSAMGLPDAEAAGRWLERNGISEQTLWTYISDELYVARLTSAYRVEVEREIALQMLMTHANQPSGSKCFSDSSCGAPAT
jgi:hypothetical protein